MNACVPGFGGLTEVFGRMSSGMSDQGLPLWADFSFLIVINSKECKVGNGNDPLLRNCVDYSEISVTFLAGHGEICPPHG